MKKLSLLLVAIILLITSGRVFSQSLGYSGGLCTGSSINIYLMGGASCGSPTVPQQSYWTINPAPSSVTYIPQGANNYLQIQVKWNTPVSAAVRVSYSCPADGGTGQTNDLILNIASPVTPSVELTTSTSSACYQNGSIITFTAAPTNGGGSPSYSYYVDGNLVHNGNQSSYAYNTSGLSVGSHSAYVTMFSSLACTTPSASATSTTKSFSVVEKSSYTVMVNGPGNICSSDPSGTFVATVATGVGTMTYQWYLNGNAVGSATTSPTYSFSSLSSGNTIYCRVSSDYWCVNTPVQSNTYTVNLTGSVTPTVSIQVPKLNFCTGETINFSSSLVAPSYSWRLNGTQFSTSSTATLPASTDVNAPDTFSPGDVVTLDVSGLGGTCYSSSTASATTAGIGLVVNALPNSIISPGGTVKIKFSAIQEITASTGSGYTYQWKQNGVPIPDAFNSTYSTNQVGTYSYTVAANSCSSTSGDLILQVNALPEADAGPDQSQTYGVTSIVLPGSASDPDGTISSYLWTKISGPSVTLGNANTATLTLTNIPAGNYTFRLKATDDTGDFAVDYVNVAVADVNNYNYIQEQNLMVKGAVSYTAITQLPIGSRTETYTYFDGLGRASEMVNTQASPLSKDMVTPMAYDEFGRQKKQYLPYISSETNGYYKINPLGTTAYVGSPQYSYYDNGETDKVKDDTFPYSETFFEASPLNRPDKNYGVGKDWRPTADGGQNKYIQHQYLINVHSLTGSATQEKVIAWELNGSGMPKRDTLLTNYVEPGGYYSTNQLIIKSTIDEKLNAVREYTNKAGQVILKKVQAVAGSSDLNNLAHWAQTYYIYDYFGNLRYVLPPELSKSVLQNDTYEPTATDLNNWAFQYKYDERNRMIEKRVPGAEAVYMVYDNRDRLVMTQDGNQRALTTKEWTFIKYDAFNRPVLTGRYATNNDRATMQSAVHAYYQNMTSAKAWFESYAGATGTLLGYDDKSFPTSQAESKYLTATYYDQHDSYIAPSGYAYTDESLSDPETLIRQDSLSTIMAVKLRGQVTGTLVRNLHTNAWLRTVNYYDAKYRLVQSIGEHQKGTIRISNVFDFTGKVALTKRTYVVNSITNTIKENPDYDHMGRLKWVKHSLNGATDIVLSKNHYNELGQLVDKKLHSTLTTGDDAKQSVDYRYNIRGWLTRINDSNLTIEENDPRDYFGMNLAYNADFESGNFSISQKSYNGNISAIKWSNGLGQGAIKERAYNFTYDAMNRLLTADNKHSTTFSSWTTGDFDEKGLTYDLNGNIKTLSRMGEGGAQIDNLVYNYGSGATLSNKLLYVKDITANATDKVKGFYDVNAGDVQDYTYDANGNLTRDLNKGIGTTLSDPTNIITYNYLNLPETVTKGGNSIRYVYDAAGRKLSQVTTFGAIGKQVDYIGELQYEDDALQFITHAEGRIVVSGTKLVLLHTGDNTSAITASNAALAAVVQNGGEKYVRAISDGTVPRTGMFPVGGTIAVAAGERYRIRAKGYRTGNATSLAHLLIKGNGTDIAWPGAKLPLGLASESWIEQIVTIPANTTTLQAGLVWNVVTTNEEMFLNEFEITKLTTNVVPEYQYNLTDHLGNVRVTFTTTGETDQSLATFENLNIPQEQSQFIYYDEAVKINAKIFDHTDQQTGSPETPPAGAINIHKEAEAYNAQSGTSVSGGALTSCDNNDWAQYNSINMTGVTALKIQCAAATQSPGRVEVRLGSTSGQVLGYLQGPNTGSGTSFSSYIIPLAAATGTQNIFLLFKDASGIMNIDWIEFMGPGPSGVPVKGISLLNTSINLTAGQTATLTKIITPAEATDQSVTWSSSDPSVATVNSSGIVTGVAIGSALITATTTSGGLKAKAAIRVKPADANMVSNSEFDSGTTNWVLGDWTGPGYTPGGNSFSTVTGAGLSGTNALFVDVVNNNNENWTLQPYSNLNFKMEVGRTYEISFMAKAQSSRLIGVALHGVETNTEYWANYVTAGTTVQTFGPYQYTCTNNTVNANSTFRIAFYLAKGVVSDVWLDKIIVKDVTPGSSPTTSVSIAPAALSLTVGQHGQITPTVLPANALNQVTWTSSNTTVAVVNGNGLVTTLATGTATITAKTAAGNYTATSTVTVSASGNNTIANGEFDSGTTGWTLGDWTGPGYTPGGSSFSTVTGAGLSGTNALFVDVVNNNNETWTLQPYNRLSHKIELGHTYEVSFMAKAQSPRTIGAALTGEQTNPNLWSTYVNLTTSPQSFGPFTYVCNNSAVEQNSTFTMAFWLALEAISDVWIDKVVVKDVTPGLISASGVSVSPSRLSLTTGQTGQLTRIISPSNATNQAVTWTSSNTGVATVNSNGVVTAVSSGDATITATSADGGFTSQATVIVNIGVTSYSTRLSGTPNERYGLAKSLSVMPGDTIMMEVYAKYLDNNTNNWNAALMNLMTAIAQGTAPTGTFVDGGAPGSIGGTTFPFVGTLPRTGDTGTGPKAYLNYIVFDKNYVYKTGGFKRISATPIENGTDVPHERLAFDGLERVIITEPGYVYIYLSNENDTPVEVYFDDFKVDHIKGPIVSSQDYYPFGLIFNSYQRENSVPNDKKFQSQEHIDDLGLNWDSFKWRNYQPEIGRFFTLDPLAAKYPWNSPYAFSENDVVNSIELEGLEKFRITLYSPLQSQKVKDELRRMKLSRGEYNKDDTKKRDRAQEEINRILEYARNNGFTGNAKEIAAILDKLNQSGIKLPYLVQNNLATMDIETIDNGKDFAEYYYGVEYAADGKLKKTYLGEREWTEDMREMDRQFVLDLLDIILEKFFLRRIFEFPIGPVGPAGPWSAPDMPQSKNGSGGSNVIIGPPTSLDPAPVYIVPDPSGGKT